MVPAEGESRMHVVEEDKAAAGGPRARFSPLKMVARALGALQAPHEAEAETPPLAVTPILSSPVLPSPVARAAQPAADEAGETFLAVVNAMMALDDEAGLEPDESRFDLVALMGEAHDAFAAAALRRGVTLALAVDPAAAGAYRGDVGRLRQMLLNLVSGGLKATADDMLVCTAGWADGALTLEIEGEAVAAVMARVLAAKQPPGPRQPAAHRLGLAHAAAVALGGEASVTPDRRIELTLPLARIAEAAAAPAQHDPAATPEAPPMPVFAPGLRVLVAEANPAHRQVLTTLLTGMGLDAVPVADGQEAVAAWREQGWDALLIDIESEAVCGRSVARSIRHAETVARWPRMPMLALAATTRMRDLDEDLAAVLDGLVAKPIQPASLAEALEAALAAHHTASAWAATA